MGRHKGKPRRKTSCQLDPKVHALCVEFGISFSDALEKGCIALLENNEKFRKLVIEKRGRV